MSDLTVIALIIILGAVFGFVMGKWSSRPLTKEQEDADPVIRYFRGRR